MIIRVLMTLMASATFFFTVLWLLKWTNFFNKGRVGKFLINLGLAVVSVIFGLMFLAFVSSIDKL